MRTLLTRPTLLVLIVALACLVGPKQASADSATIVPATQTPTFGVPFTVTVTFADVPAGAFLSVAGTGFFVSGTVSSGEQVSGGGFSILAFVSATAGTRVLTATYYCAGGGIGSTLVAARNGVPLVTVTLNCVGPEAANCDPGGGRFSPVGCGAFYYCQVPFYNVQLCSLVFQYCGADSAFGNQAQCYNLLFCQTGLNTSNAQTCNTLKPRATQPGACVPMVLNGGLNPYYPVGSLEPIFVSCSPTTPSTCSGGSATSECNLLPGLLGNCVANPILPPNYCQPATGSALTPTTGQPSAPPHSAGPAS